MMILRTLYLSLLVLSLPMSSLSRHISTSNPSSFKVALIHRDSPFSPLYDHSASPSDLLQRSAQRSISRLRHMSLVLAAESSPSKLQSTVKAGPNEFLMKVGVGTPVNSFWLIADTGSDLSWIQCLPCERCFNQSVPIFDPKSSSTYQQLACSSPQCQALAMDAGCYGEYCQYSMSYGDGSSTSGPLLSETFIFETPESTISDIISSTTSAKQTTDHGTSAKIKRLAFGCGTSNAGSFGNDNEQGLVGLGGGPLSLISQLGRSISNKFSYCLPSRLDENVTSVLNFGENADIQASDVSSTQLIQLEGNPTFFLLNLTGISVGSKRLDIPPLYFDPTQNGEPFLIDSGTSLTILGPDVYDKLADEVEKAIDLPKTDPPRPFSLCFEVPDSGNITGLPNITFHFSGNADWINGPENSFIPLDDGHMICLGILGASQGMSILGNWAQQNRVVEYDVGKRMLSFAPARCGEV
ncbi:hypothetical protein AMTR_s00095p00166180 [Amborella trichopoda]|uniref:Peptidase A1 domain-containing protein n=2 Tax=Amborella trichopoda TaxID=13333 RepID=W1NUB7_AMBTC|nr:hypothetical protein AMTR_s00095p00166180 [Amborella trichopoda]